MHGKKVVKKKVDFLKIALIVAIGAIGCTQIPIQSQSQGPVCLSQWGTMVVSWYGPGFHGRTTANGERYDMYALTAAHPTLPLGSWVRVERQRTGRSVIVRINDRGPFIEGREIDLSYRAACRLGIDRQGLARVRFELLELPPRRRWPTTQAAD